MAYPVDLAKLSEGVEAWNWWREEHWAELPNLREANLSRTDLRGANLRGADLQKTDLTSANLQGADLLEANLQGADLRGADLQEAAFDTGTRLGGAMLSDGESRCFSVADLNWGGANLAVVDWTQVKVLGDEYEAQQPKALYRGIKTKAARIFDYHTAVRANRQLAVVLRDQGLNEEADYFAYRAQRLQRIVLRRQGLLPGITFWQRVRNLSAYAFSGFLDFLAGYGYRPARTLLWYLFVITAFTTAYAILGHLPLLPDALVFSFMSFHGRGFFPSLSAETNLHNPGFP
jgi:hypothetical protein